MRLVDAMLWPQRRPTKLKSDKFLSDPSPIIVLLCHLVTESVLLLNFAQIVEFVKVVTLINLIVTGIYSWYMNFSKLLYGFVKTNMADLGGDKQ